MPAVANAGLPLASIPAFLEELGAGNAAGAAKIQGVTPAILEVAAVSFKEAYARSFKVVYLATIAFGGLSFIASFFVPDIDDKLTSDVIRRLGSQNDLESKGSQDKEAASDKA